MLKRTTCKCCKKSFVSTNEKQTYCCKRCSGLKTHDNYLAYAKRKCVRCGREYAPVRKWQIYCDKKCRHDDWNEKNDAAAKMREYRAKLRAEAAE